MTGIAAFVEELELGLDVMREVGGDLGAHLRLVAEAHGVAVVARGTTVRVAGEDRAAIARAMDAVRTLVTLAEGGRGVHPRDVRDVLRVQAADPGADVGQTLRDVLVLDQRKRPVTARSPGQAAWVEIMRTHAMAFGVGPAGTGKTFLAMVMALTQLRRGSVKRIVLTRPAVEAGEKLGFLPGDLAEKVDPYLRPLFDAMGEIADPREIAELMSRGMIEVAPLAFMRGRTLQDAFVVLDEAQNTTVEQMKMFLTRLGDRSRMIITGDPSQVDLPRGQRSGLVHALEVLDGAPGIGIARMQAVDVVRHPLVATVLARWDA